MRLFKILLPSLIFTSVSLQANENMALSALGCMLEPSKKVEVSSSVGGVIDRIPAKRGDTVRRGAVLFSLKAGVEKAAVELAKVKAEFSERKVIRNKELYQDDLLSPHEKDEIETELLMAKMELRLKNAELSLRTIRSPISGVVVDKLHSEGEYVSVDPVMQLATLNPLHVDVLLPAQYFGQITKGQQLLVKPDAINFSAKKAKVSIVDPLIDPASGTFRVQLKMSNPGNKLPAGLRCQVETIPSTLEKS